jgi:hypothetical protein
VRRHLITLVVAISLAAIGAAAAPAAAQAVWGVPNGCGSGGWVNDVLGSNPYNAQFTPACNLHDWCYGGAAQPVSRGAMGDWIARKRCDDLFDSRMLATCGDDAACRLAAADYYAAVRTFGDSILFGKPYTSGQRDGQANLLPNPRSTTCSGCAAGVAWPTLHVNVRGSQITYWKLNAGPWHRISCSAWDPNHVACAADVTLQLTTPGAQTARVKAVDTYTGAVGKTWPVAVWTF